MQAAPGALEALSDGPSRRTRAWHWVVLAALLTLAAWLRVGLVGRMAPQRPEPDAYLALQYDVLAGREPLGATARGKAQSLFSAYPSFVVRPLVALLGDSPYAPASTQAALDAHLAAAARPLVTVRRWCAWICVAGVAGVFFLVRELSGPRAGLVACAFTTFSLLHLVYSHQARPHAPHMTFAVWALYALVRHLERPSALRLCAAGVALWAGLASLQTGLFLAPAFLVATWLAPGARALKYAALLVLAAAYSLAQPFHGGGVELSEEGVSMAAGGHAIELSDLSGGGIGPTWRTLRDQEPAVTLLALVGVALAWMARRRAARAARASLALAAYCVPYLALALVNQATRDRYLIPLLPFLALLAAYAVELGARRVERRSRWLAGALIAAALAPAAWDGLVYFRAARRPDTLAEAAAWLARQPDAATGRVVTSPYVVLPLASTRAALESVPRRTAGESAWLGYQLALPAAGAGATQYDLRPFTLGRDERAGDERALEERLEALAPSYVVLETSRRQRALRWHASFESLVRAKAERVASFDPEDCDPPRDELFEYGDVEGLRKRAARARRLGPPLEIYRWRAP